MNALYLYFPFFVYPFFQNFNNFFFSTNDINNGIAATAVKTTASAISGATSKAAAIAVKRKRREQHRKQKQ